MDRKILTAFLHKPVSLLKSDDFLIWGKITKVSDDCILFYTDGKSILLSFDRIKEIQPQKRRQE